MNLPRAIAASVWMGWKREVEWTNPLLSLVIKAIAPIAVVLMAAAVYWYGSSFVGAFNSDRLAFIVVGASLYAQVGGYAFVPTAAIAEGKSTNVYPQVFITPASSIPYLAGRCFASFASSVPVVVASLTVSYFASLALFGALPALIASPASALMLSGALIASLPGALGLGYLLGGYSVFVSKFEWALPSYISGVLMIFSEALFPSSVLPWPLGFVAEALPFTYFMRASRAALISGIWSDYAISMIFCVLTGLVFLVVGVVAFKWSEHDGRRKGFIDRKLA
jgi:ABC-type polysaccharide/polyol phosphate export permease